MGIADCFYPNSQWESEGEGKQENYLNIGPKRIMCKVGTKGNMVTEEINTIKKKQK